MRRIVNNIIFIYLFFVFILVFWYYNIWKKILIKMFFSSFGSRSFRGFIYICVIIISRSVYMGFFFSSYTPLTCVFCHSCCFCFSAIAKIEETKFSVFSRFAFCWYAIFSIFFKYNFFLFVYQPLLPHYPQKLFRIRIHKNQPTICANSEKH